MRRILRTVGLAAAIAGTLGLGLPPAAASGGVYSIVGDGWEDCFGCGTTDGYGTLCVSGSSSNGEAAACVYQPNARAASAFDFIPNESMEYTAVEGDLRTSAAAGPVCLGLVTGTASGVMYGVIHVYFNWVRLGDSLLITTFGDVNGAGVGTFTIVGPLGNPCGQSVEFRITAEIAGT
jgi:hypothetical protein